MPSFNKQRSPLATKLSNNKPQSHKAKGPSSKMDTSAPAEPVWTTEPIMEVDRKEKPNPHFSAAVQKQSLSNLNPKQGGMKQKKPLSKKAKQKKELATLKAQGFKDQLDAKIARQKGGH
jgi:hypothetical protein